MSTHQRAKIGLPPIAGTCDPLFRPVRDAFAENFSSAEAFPELGAAFAVHDGRRLLVDLWGGYRDLSHESAWQPDTLVNLWSTTKGVMALIIARLVGEGRCAYDAPVADYWPAFAAAGKGEVTVGQLLSHQAGLNGFDSPTTVSDFGNWVCIADKLANQAPAWPVGQETSYHAITFGFLAGELARQITGQSPRELFEAELARPLKLDLHLGIPVSDRHRVSPVIPPDIETIDATAIHPLALRALVNPQIDAADANQSSWREAQIPAANGHGTARALATLWGMVASRTEHAALPTPAAVDQMRKVRSSRDDLMLGPGHWGSGVMLNRSGMFGPGEQAFGHCGWGGSLGFADPESGIGVGYIMNRMGRGLLHDTRVMRLTEVTAKCIGRAGAD